MDADEILPRDFLKRMVQRLQYDPQCGFVQANHVCLKGHGNRLKKDMFLGVDIHWKWYQPLRNRFGFVMFLGHGALLRTSCWKQVGGFPELVSEDLAYAIAIRELGYYGTFASDVVCKEDFPESVRAFRVRHIKWTRGKSGWRLFRFLCHSTALYAALSPVTTVAVLGYMITGKARFLVTGDKDDSTGRIQTVPKWALLKKVTAFLSETHPDHSVLRSTEFIAGVFFLVIAVMSFQVAFTGLAIGFMLMPFMHKYGWDHAVSRVLVWMPFSLILIGISMGGIGVLGIYPVMFGYGFHF